MIEKIARAYPVFCCSIRICRWLNILHKATTFFSKVPNMRLVSGVEVLKAAIEAHFAVWNGEVGEPPDLVREGWHPVGTSHGIAIQRHNMIKCTIVDIKHGNEGILTTPHGVLNHRSVGTTHVMGRELWKIVSGERVVWIQVWDRGHGRGREGHREGNRCVLLCFWLVFLLLWVEIYRVLW